MSGDTNRNLPKTAIVVALCAAIGFGAVYAMVSGGDNRARGQSAVKKKAPAAVEQPSPAAAGLGNATPASGTEGSAGGPLAAALLSGTDGRPLNRGAMTTFVFKKQAMAVAKPPTFNGPDGKPMTLSDLKGKIVLLNLWATWCAPCRKEMPHLNQLQEELGSDQFEVFRPIFRLRF